MGFCAFLLFCLSSTPPPTRETLRSVSNREERVLLSLKIAIANFFFFFFLVGGGGGGSGVGGRNFLVDFPDAKKDSDRDFFQVFM